MTEKDVLLALLRTPTIQEELKYSETEYKSVEEILHSNDVDPVILAAAFVIRGRAEKYNSDRIWKLLLDAQKRQQRS